MNVSDNSVFFFFCCRLKRQTTPSPTSQSPWRAVPPTTSNCLPTCPQSSQRQHQLACQTPLCRTVRGKPHPRLHTGRNVSNSKRRFWSMSAFSFSSAVETLRQLILRDLEGEGQNHDTPTNETAGEQDRLWEHRPSSETVLKMAEEREPQEDAQHQDAEQPGFQVVRKGRKQASSDGRNLKPSTKMAA